MKSNRSGIPRRYWLGIALWMAAGLVCSRQAGAQATSLEIGRAKLEELKNRFAADKAKLHQSVTAQFDALIAGISKQTNLSSADRAESVERWKKIKQQLLEEGTLPPDPEFAKIAFDYGTKLGAIYLPVLKKYTELDAMAAKQNRSEFAALLETDRANFEAKQLFERGELVAGSRWRGERYFKPDATTTHVFEVNEVAGDLLRMTSHQDSQYAGHPVYEVAGKFTGPQFTVNYDKLINGKSKFQTFSGVVLGKTMFVQAIGSDPGGAPVKELMILSKQR